MSASRDPASIEIHPADRRARLVLLAVVAVAAVVAVLALDWLQRETMAAEALAERDPATATRRAAELSGVVFTAVGWGSALLGVHLLVVGVRTARDGRHPPRRARTVRDTPILRGAAARRRAVAAVLVGLLLLGAGLWLPGFAEQRVRGLFERQGSGTSSGLSQAGPGAVS